jgi:predicted transcriptional regulator
MAKGRAHRTLPEERRILLVLHARGYRHCKVAAALNVSRALVSMWLNGKRTATAEHIKALRNIEYGTS